MKKLEDSWMLKTREIKILSLQRMLSTHQMKRVWVSVQTSMKVRIRCQQDQVSVKDLLELMLDMEIQELQFRLHLLRLCQKQRQRKRYQRIRARVHQDLRRSSRHQMIRVLQARVASQKARKRPLLGMVRSSCLIVLLMVMTLREVQEHQAREQGVVSSLDRNQPAQSLVRIEEDQ